jgi:hypothetical protein
LCNDFFALVVTAFGAHYVAFDKFVALGALNKSGCRKLPVCKTGIGLGFGDFIFRNSENGKVYTKIMHHFI